MNSCFFMLTSFKAEFQGFWILCKEDGKSLEDSEDGCDVIESNLYKLHAAYLCMMNVNFLFVFVCFMSVRLGIEDLI